MQTTTKVTQRTATGASGQQVAILAFSGDISSASKDAILGAYRGLNGAAGKVLLNFSGVDTSTPPASPSLSNCCWKRKRPARDRLDCLD